MSGNTTEKLTPAGKKIMAQFAKLSGGVTVKAGVQSEQFAQAKQEPSGSKGSKQATTLGLVAVANEYGTKTIPARPFIRATANAKRESWIQMAGKLRKRLVSGELTIEELFGLVGLQMVKDIKQTVLSSVPPPNAPSTVKKKGSSKTLIDTGQLLNSIWHKVMKGKANGT